MQYLVSTHPSAVAALLDIIDYIRTELQNEAAAIKQYQDFLSAIQSLEINATLHQVYIRTESGIEYRRINVNNYAMLYVVLDNSVEIVKIFHGSQDITVTD